MALHRRMVDGELWFRSSKVRSVSPRYRIHIPVWYTLADAGGTFICEAEIIHREIYAGGMMPGVSLAQVRDMLREFREAGLIETWENGGQRLGRFTGNEAPGLLPGPATVKRYKNLLPSNRRAVADDSATSRHGFGLDRLGKVRLGLTWPASDEEKPEEPEMNKEAKPIFKAMVAVWRERVNGYVTPMFRGRERVFEERVAGAGNKIVDAFRLWVEENFDADNDDPIMDFIMDRRFRDYMRAVAEVTGAPVDRSQLDAIEARRREAAQAQKADEGAKHREGEEAVRQAAIRREAETGHAPVPAQTENSATVEELFGE